MTKVKICGLRDAENLHVAIQAGADFIGLVFYPPSPRNLDYHAAANLRQLTPKTVKAVGLFVDPTDADLEKFALGLKLDMIQLHGNESPERVDKIKLNLGLPVMKAIPIATPADTRQIEEYEEIVDWLLFDAKSDSEKGGTGKSFDWNILSGRKFLKPWMLSGGLTAANVKDALKILKPDAVDVSSGVERERGIKDAQKIRDFIEAVKGQNQVKK